MKTIKLALLGTAALAAASMAAKADDLDALKAEIEALNSRVAQLEAAPAVPAGYQLLTVTEADATPFVGDKPSDFVGRDRKATVIGILPTADMPATTTIEWHGQIRTALTYTDAETAFITSITGLTSGGIFFSDTDADDLDVNVRGRLWVRATTDTAVGEVGVQIRLESDVGIADAGEELNMDIAWGWWQMTPELQLAGGYTDSLVAIEHGMDWQATFGNTGGTTNRSTDQMRLTYASGPMSFALSIEESEANTTAGLATYLASVGPFIVSTVVTAVAFGNTASDRGDVPAIAARFSYAGDAFSAGVYGIWQEDDGHTVFASTTFFAATGIPNVIDGDDDYFVGGGVTYSGDMFLISAAAGFGEGYAGGYNGAAAVANDDSYWGASIFARINVSDSAYFEAGYGYSELDWLETYDGNWPNPAYVQGGEVETHTVNVGMYYAPVSQLTIGLQGDYRSADYDLVASGAVPPASGDVTVDRFSASLVTWFSF